MAEKWFSILKDLLDDHNMILYALFVLALCYPQEQKFIVGAIAGFWADKKVVKQ